MNDACRVRSSLYVLPLWAYVSKHHTMKKEYKVAVYAENLAGSILLGKSRIDPARFAQFLNTHADEGWRVVTIEREDRRELAFFKREAMVIVLERDKITQ
jgi:hypothetical protein